ncbi:hypothetical protein DMUE_6166, partial [Dictyocoela muelleri]
YKGLSHEKLTGKSLVENFKSLIKEFGTPKFVISDNGKQYVGNDFKNFLKLQNNKHLLILPCSQISNGISEIVNKSITESLRFNKGKNLNSKKTYIEFKIIINFNRNLKTSPTCLLTGYDFHDPLNIKR